jgi:hypothetical protein
MRLNPDATEILYTSAALNPASAASPPGPRTPELEHQKVRLLRAAASGGVGQLLLEAEGINNFQCARAPSQVCVFSRFADNGLAIVQFDPATGVMNELFRASDPGWQDYNWTLSPDGKLLALCKQARVSEDTKIRLVTLEDGTERAVHIKEWAAILAFDWAADGKSFWASAILRGESRSLVNIDLHGSVKPLIEGGKPYIGWAIPSRDGKHLAVWQSTGGSNAWMLDGF